MGTRSPFLSILLCLVLINFVAVLGYPSKSSSDSDEDTQQLQQQQNIDSDSFEEFTQKIQSSKGGRRRKPEKVQVVEVEPEPYDQCLDAKKTGPCKAHIPRYFFNKESGSCELYAWGGCSKNGNNFRDLSDCESTCSKHLKKGRTEQEEPDSSSVIEICEQEAVPKEGIICAAYIPRWTYNAKDQKCEEFIWGGCPKTANNFPTEAVCQSTCSNYPKYKGLTEELPEPTTEQGFNLEQHQQQQDADESENVCDLPAESGLCMAMFEKYYFNKINNRCEKFIYGGCGGNKNRFDNADECLRTCGGDNPVKDIQCSDVDCPWALYEHYTSLGCSPIYDGDACCPTRYECSDQLQEVQNNTLESRSLTLDKDGESTTISPDEEDSEVVISTSPPKCRYRGKYYSVGEMVPEASDTGSCRTGCLCADSGNPNIAPNIICAQIECPEHFTGPPQGKENCVPLYKKGACCAHDYYCPEGELTVIEPNKPQRPEKEEEKPLAKCEVDGESVYEGQRVYPNKSPCSRCLCQRNPANETALEGQLYCEKVDCGIEIHYSSQLARGCAPVYFEREDGTTSCCPISWECPEDNNASQKEGEEEPESSTTPGSPLLPEPPKPPSTDSPTSPDTNEPSSPLVRTREACEMEKEEGDCKGQRPRFFFNKDTGNCEPFNYSGCRGNLNNFASLEDCKSLCESSSPLVSPSPPAKGGKTAGGPGGPGLLGRSRSLPSPSSSSSSPGGSQQEMKAISLTELDPCTLPRKVGRCKGYFPRFYYSPEENECRLFIFGGCRPNANNFYSKDSCEATCLNKIPVENLRTNVPAALANPSSRARTATSTVVDSGGDASKVNFGEERPSGPSLRSLPAPKRRPSGSSEEDDPCSLPPRTGRCKAFVRRFYYDVDKKTCKGFTYGGCSGNGNNFKTVEECEERCSSKKVVELPPPPPPQPSQPGATGDNLSSPKSLPPSASFTARCKLPKAAGSCHNSIKSYYYDAESKSCKLFFYSGCFGNANRFASREDCENMCKKPLESEGGSSSSSSNPDQPQHIHELRESEESSVTPSSAEVLDPVQKEKEFCKLDPDAGSCNEKQLRFYYDASAEQCLPFVYSGCEGNRNNFVTETECMSSCGTEPTLEQLAEQMVLSCTFGNDTVPLGSTVVRGGGGVGNVNQDDQYSGDEIPCGKTVCQCITPPAVTCVKRNCPKPTTTTTEKICATPSCHPSCKVATGLDGCPTCDCDESRREEEEVVVVKKGPAKGVKG